MKKTVPFSLLLSASCTIFAADVGPAGGRKTPDLPAPIVFRGGGRTFFVDNGHAAASDANPGTREEPWKTISRGVRELGAGDALYIRRGVYREAIDLGVSGEKGKPVLISGYEDEVVVEGRDRVGGWEPLVDHAACDVRLREGRRVTGWRPGATLPGPVPEISRLPAVSATMPEGFPLEGDEAEEAGSARGAVHRTRLLVDGRPVPRVFEAGDLQQGSWYLDRPGRRVLLWPPDSADVRELDVRIARASVTRGRPSRGRAAVHRAAYPGLVLPPETEGAKSWKSRGQTYREMVFADGVRLVRMFARGDLQEGTWYLDAGAKELYVWPPGSRRMGEVEITAGAREYLFRTRGQVHDVIVRGIRFQGAANKRKLDAVLLAGDRILLEDVTVAWCRARGLRVAGGSGHIVRRCVVEHMGQLGISVVGSKDSLVEKSVFRHNNWAYGMGWETGGSKFCFTRNLIVLDTAAHDNIGPGIWFDIDNHGGRVLGCAAFRNMHSGIFYEISFGGEIADCVAFGNYMWDAADWSVGGAWGMGIANRGSPDSRIHHNAIFDNRVGIGVMGWGNVERNWIVRDNEYSHNVFAGNRIAAIAMFDGGAPELRCSRPESRNRIHHNLYAPTGGPAGTRMAVPFQILWGSGYRSPGGPDRAFRSLDAFRKAHGDQAEGSLEGRLACRLLRPKGITVTWRGGRLPFQAGPRDAERIELPESAWRGGRRGRP